MSSSLIKAIFLALVILLPMVITTLTRLGDRVSYELVQSNADTEEEAEDGCDAFVHPGWQPFAWWRGSNSRHMATSRHYPGVSLEVLIPPPDMC